MLYVNAKTKIKYNGSDLRFFQSVKVAAAADTVAIEVEFSIGEDGPDGRFLNDCLHGNDVTMHMSVGRDDIEAVGKVVRCSAIHSMEKSYSGVFLFEGKRSGA